ncbi:hypothetical protein I79_001545 [Cricetulus griseus]|uniref:Uncharacterized protein n=1 Tax=Cricetulus griseus TaxID=10029 RepID=G3GV18_CRIGR|nr:hypothetical protein I79_001545 [Cricetulus griseus]
MYTKSLSMFEEKAREIIAYIKYKVATLREIIQNQTVSEIHTFKLPKPRKPQFL